MSEPNLLAGTYGVKMVAGWLRGQWANLGPGTRRGNRAGTVGQSYLRHPQCCVGATPHSVRQLRAVVSGDGRLEPAGKDQLVLR